MLGDRHKAESILPEWLADSVRNRVIERLNSEGRGNLPTDLSKLNLDELIQLGQDRGLVAIPPPLPVRS